MFFPHQTNGSCLLSVPSSLGLFRARSSVNPSGPRANEVFFFFFFFVRVFLFRARMKSEREKMHFVKSY